MRKNNMKKNNLAKMIIAAFSLLSTVLLANAGDIYSIDLVKDHGGVIPTADNPLRAGETAVIRVRMLNKASGKPWVFMPSNPAASTNLLQVYYAPEFALQVGGNERAAEYVETRNLDSNYTDLYFQYKVAADDLALPALYIGEEDGKVIDDSSTSTSYKIKLNNVNDSYWSLLSNSTKATMSFATSIDLSQSWLSPPTDVGSWSRNATPSGRGLELYIKSVDLDSNYVDLDNGIWRSVGLNKAKTSNNVQPSVVLTGGAATSAVTVYVWVESPTATTNAVPFPRQSVSNPNGAYEYTDKVGTRLILPVTVPAGSQSQSFQLKGLSANSTATVCMSSSKDRIPTSGTTVFTNWVSRTINVVPLDSAVSFTLTPDELKCTTDYKKKIGTLVVELDESPTGVVNVAINSSVDVFGANATNYLALSFNDDTDPSKHPWLDCETNLTFAAGATGDSLKRTLFVYAFGSTNTLEDATNPVKLTPILSGASAGQFKAEGCDLTLARAVPAIDTAETPTAITDAVLGEDYKLDIAVAGSYFDMNSDGWSVRYKVKQGTKTLGDEVVTNNLSVVSGKLTITLRKEDLRLKADGLELWVVSPSGVTSSHVTIPLTVNLGKEAWARIGSVDGSSLETYAEGSSTADIFFSLSEDYTTKLYAFLKPEDESITNQMSCSAFAVTNMAVNSGVAIDRGDTASLFGTKISVLDGDAIGRFTVKVCTSSTYDPAKEVSYVGESTITIVATNVAPRVKSVTQGSAVATNGGTLSNSGTAKILPLGKEIEFLADIFEPSKVDRTASGTDVFRMEWSFDDDPTGWHQIDGDPGTNVVKHTFSQSGTRTIRVRCQDKDMRKEDPNLYGEEFTFKVEVDKKPAISIKSATGASTFYEDDTSATLSMFKVSLVGAPVSTNGPLKVQIDVAPYGTGSHLATDVVLSTNIIEFASGDRGDDDEHYFYFSELNGTIDSENLGFTLTAKVINQSVDIEGKTWVEDSVRVRILNRPPVLSQPIELLDGDGKPVVTKTTIGANLSLPWAVSDVRADATNLTITCTTSENKTTTVTTTSGAMSGTIPFSFREAGENKTVTITVSDPDYGTASVTRYFSIDPSKQLIIAATGPSDGNSKAPSSRYAMANGRGEGRVYVSTNDASFAYAEGFNLYWDCGDKTMVAAYAYGYQPGENDSNTLTPGDLHVRLDTFGNNTAGISYVPSTSDAYTYQDSLYGCYFYGWIEAGEPGGTDFSISVKPEFRGEKKFVSSRTYLNLPKEMTDDEKGYAQTYAEAVFSKEWATKDNMGDINQDGVPDYFATYSFKNGQLSEPDGKGSELAGVGDANADNDYYPSTSQLGATKLIPGASSGWATSGGAYNAMREIRGYGDGLNYGMFKTYAANGQNITQERDYGWVSDLDLTDNEKRSLLRHAFARRDQILENVAKVNGGDFNHYASSNLWSRLDEWAADDWIYITNMLKTVVRAGTSHKSGFLPVYYDYTDWSTNSMVSIIGVPETNDVSGVSVVTTNDCWQFVYTNTGKNTATNIIKMVVSTFTNTMLNVEVTVTNNPSDYITFDDVNIGDWLSIRMGDSSQRPEQIAAKAYIDHSWQHYTETGAWGWTCENRTDPTVADTDGDEIPDGYEYFLWYDAVVGTQGTNRLTGCRFNLGDIESREDEITPEDIAKIYNPNIKGTNWKSLDTDKDGISDYEEFLIGTSPVDWDTDRDGLSDLYEVIYNINPLSDGQGVNGAMNLDGDYMAFITAEAAQKLYAMYSTTNKAYGVYANLANAANYTYVQATTNGTLWMLDADYVSSALLIDPETNCLTVVASGFEVVPFNEGYTLPTDKTKGFAPKASVTLVLDPQVEIVTNATLSLYHSQVYNYFGFDPRTGWYKDANGDCTTRFAGAAAEAFNTSAFTAKDEYRLLKFRYLTGLRNYNTDVNDLKANKTTIYSIILNGTTNPNKNFSGRKWGDSETTYTQNQHGADTDGDGVPDGWELYLGVNPNRDYRIAYGSPGYDDLYYNLMGADGLGDDDGLGFAAEYAGTDTCGYYSDCPTIYANHPTREGSLIYGWRNKFVPTDPLDDDTDGDGLKDATEGKNWSGTYTMNRWGQDGNRSKETTSISGVNYYMIYGENVDVAPGISCVKGGGYNPCSIDTDGDGLPDPWEHQYTGLLFLNDEIVTEANTGVDDFYVFNPDNGMPTGAYDDIRAAASALGWDFSVYTNDVFHIVMGQDGTVSDATSTYGLKSHDRDWDSDGLENWQEYLIQAMRQFRYDDDKTPLLGRDIPLYNDSTGEIEEGAWNGDKGFLKLSYYNPITTGQYETLENLGYTNFVAYVKSHSDYLADLGYFAPPPKDWDTAGIGGRKYMLPPKLERTFRGGSTKTYTPVTDLLGQTIWRFNAPGEEYELFTTTAAATMITNIGTIVNYVPGTSYAPGTILSETNSLGMTKVYKTPVIITDPTLGVVTNYARVKQLYTLTSSSYGKISLTQKASKYVGTDPRLWDTDEDGMDDYYELFHGLNPILGSIGAISSDTSTSEASTNNTFALSGIIMPPITGAKDTIYEAFHTVSAWCNGWVGWDNTERPAYDPIKYPWMMGEGLCDADGDGLRNEEEAISANFTDPKTYHTDPTPLWMTDATIPVEDYDVTVTVVTTNILGYGDYDFTTGSFTVFMELETNTTTTVAVELAKTPSYTQLFYGNSPAGRMFGASGSYIYSFEQNEGYDTDNDWRSDSVEMRQTAEPTSDPLDAGDVVRRQSIWFGGATKPGAAISYEPSRRTTYGYDFYRQFTVEAWIMPNNPKTGVDQYVVSRASNYPGWDGDHTNDVIRMNFALGIDGNGEIFGEMQDSAETTFRLTGGNPTSNKWTHVAATYDGNTFTLYVDGKFIKSQQTTLIPANGVTDPLQDPQYTGAFPYERYTYTIVPSITILGARAAGEGAFDVNAAGAATGWTNIATDFFAGSVAEVRIWDGARSADAIAKNSNVRFDAQTVKDLRIAVYNQERSGKRRNAGNLDPELVQHYGFGSLPGATVTNCVQKVPAGFKANVLNLVRNPTTGAAVDDSILNVGWWAPIATNSAIGSVYSSPHVVPWIENTVSHLPRLWGGLADSVFWSENFAGYTPAKFHTVGGVKLEKYDIANSMNPYNVINTGNEEEYAYQKTYRLAQSAYAGGGATAADNSAIRSKYLYDSRMCFTGTTDLVPLGSAFAKRLTESWDGMGAESAWAVTTDGTAGTLDGDTNDDGVADAWAAAHVGKTSLDYLRDLSNGWLPTGADSAYANKEDVDGDGMPDWWEKYYSVFADGADDDTDFDGLSNYQEYLIGEVYRDMSPTSYTFERLNPKSAHSVAGKDVTDYFLKYGSVYYGELFADHDQIEDWWEDEQPAVLTFGGTSEANYSRYVYDANRDVRGNGWDNWSLARAWFYEAYTSNVVSSTVNSNSGETTVTTNATLFSKVDENGGNPTPTLHIRVTYNGKRGNLGNSTTKYQLVIKAWGMENVNDPQMLGKPDKIWGKTVPSQNSLLIDGALSGFSSTTGAVRPGKNMFVAYVAEGEFSEGSAAPDYVPGMPYGVAMGVDVGPIGSSYINIEMTDFNPSIPRVNIPEALKIQDVYASIVGDISDEEKKACFERMATTCTDRGLWATDQLTPAYKMGKDTHGAASNTLTSVKVTILRSGFNDKYLDKDSGNLLSSTNKLVERVFPVGVHDVLTEADFLSESDDPDLDWGGARKTCDETGYRFRDITNAYYRIVVFDGTTDDGVDNNNLCTMFVNKFEKGTKQSPVANMDEATYSGQPTFVWTHTNTIDKAYPAFQLRVWDIDSATSKTNCIFDSGVLRAPARDAEGRYKWTAPLWTGCMTKADVEFKAGETYYWSVSMLDAKFTEPCDDNETLRAFSMQKTSPSGEASDYGMIPVKVKYMGPGSVATSTYKGCLRIEAFSTPDFKGVPYGAAYISDLANLTNENAVVENAMVTGLPTSQKYYVRAYIDSDGDGELDPWESWGYVCHLGDQAYGDFYSPRAIEAGNAVLPENCVIYVEDSDTNCNMIPDIWEYEHNGSLDATKSLTPYIAYSSNGDYTSHTNAIATVVGGQAGAKLRLLASSSPATLAFQTALASFAKGTVTAPELVLLGVNINTSDSAHIKISSFTLEEGMSLEVVVDDSIDAVAKSGLPLTNGQVDVTVEYATTLAGGGDWKGVGETVRIMFPLTAGTFEIPAKDLSAINDAMAEASKECGGSCYFRVKAVASEK